MNNPNQQLLNYIKERTAEGASTEVIKKILLQNDWSATTVDEAFSTLGITEQNNPPSSSISESGLSNINSSSFEKESLTMDKIIEKFIPITGALLLIIGFGYLIYANAWVNLEMEIRLSIGFFFSVAIIGGSFSFSERMRYFADIGIGSGVLLLYATLIYGSRATDIASAMIPEMVTLFTAAIFTVAISYFASKRNSKVILILGMLGAYITPFVIGQNDVWVNNLSFNAYLIYFIAINISIFLIGKEISVRDIIPLNIVGLFVGVSTLWGLSVTDGINAARTENLLSGEVFTAILFTVLVVFTIWSILLSAKRFLEKDDGYLSLGYITPIIWFAFNISNLKSLADTTVGICYAVIAASCFLGWHVLQDTKTRFQHTALYAAGLVSSALAVFALFEDFNVITSMVLAYSSLIFAFLFVVDSAKSERFISYMLVSFIGSILSIQHILEAESAYETLLIVIALLPAIATYFVAKKDQTNEFISTATAYSVVWSIIASLFVISEFLEYVDFDFLLFYLAPSAFLTYVAYVTKVTPEKVSYDSRSSMLRVTLFMFALSFTAVFFQLIVSIYPAPTDVFLFTHTDDPINWLMIKGVFGTLILFLGLWISRLLQIEQVIKRPSFILVIFGYSSLLLTGNYFISAIMNDLEVPLGDGGPRAVATTLWWLVIAIFMLYKGIKSAKKYHAEKLLGLMLLGITLIKIILYDIVNMGMQNKIIILMLVGGAMLLFSYRVRAKGLLEKSAE